MSTIETWDNTKLQAYVCEMKGKLSMEEHLVSNEPAEALEFGKAFHKAVEVWTRARMSGQPEHSSVELAKAAAKKLYEQNMPPEVMNNLSLLGDRRSIENLWVLFDLFTKRFPFEMYEEILAVETPFTLYLGKTPSGIDINWSGILDRAVKWNGLAYYVDFKTSSYALNDKFFSKFKLSGQMTGYAWAGQELGVADFDGIMVQGVEVKVPGQQRFKKNGEPYARAPRPSDEFIQMDTYPIHEEHIEEWKKDTLQKIDDIHRARERQHYIMNRGDLCNQFNGCQFLKICEALPSMRESVKERDFHKREWNPLDRDGAND